MSYLVDSIPIKPEYLHAALSPKPAENYHCYGCSKLYGLRYSEMCVRRQIPRGPEHNKIGFTDSKLSKIPILIQKISDTTE